MGAKNSIINNGVINQGNTPAILAGALALQPAQGYEGLVYIANDAGNEGIYQYLSGAWVLLTTGGGGSQNLQQVLTVGNTTTLDILLTDANVQIISTLNGKFIGVRNNLDNTHAYLILRSGAVVLEFQNITGDLFTLKAQQPSTGSRDLILPDTNGTLAASVEGNTADSVGNITLPTLPVNGTWNPVFSNLSAGITSVVTSENWNYTQIGDTVMCFGSCVIDSNLGAGVQENFQVSLPVNSDFTSGNASTAAGSAIGDQATRMQGGFIDAELTSNPGLINVFFDIQPSQTVVTSFHFSYKVI